jgi:3',5'-cyclic-AMP phosphodiesterase
MAGDISRRELIIGAGAAASALSVTGFTPVKRKRVLRIAHLTDIHVQPEQRAGAGMAKCLQHVNDLKDKPDVLLTGGDLIMDALTCGPDRLKVQWDIFTKVLRDYNDIPVRHCLGNHDAWPQAPRNSGDYDYAKKHACDALDLRTPYYTLDRDNWHMIVLDSTYLTRGAAYTAKLGTRQFEWLQDELRRTPQHKHILVLSHIPILSVAPYLFSPCEKHGNWNVPGMWMHTDARKIKDLFRLAGNVRLCLSGHMHMVDRVDYLGTTYLCNGAVCGNWWGGRFQETEPGYALVDIYSDGTFDREYVTYGWKRGA